MYVHAYEICVEISDDRTQNNAFRRLYAGDDFCRV